MTDLASQQYLDYPEAAKRLHVSERWLRRARTERRIPFHKFGHLVRFHVDDLDEYARQQRVGSLEGR